MNYDSPIEGELDLAQDPQPLSDQEKLRLFLENRGTSKAWLARQFDKHNTWTAKVLNGTVKMTDKLKADIERVCDAKIF